MSATKIINDAAKIIKDGGIISYPTEAVYGLGCDPFKEKAVHRLHQLKGRPTSKAYIVIASDWQQVASLLTTTGIDLAPILTTIPSFTTWVFPASDTCPLWLQADTQTLAIRITNHPIARALCDATGQALISTSANFSGQPPLREYQAVVKNFGDRLDYILPGGVDLTRSPSEIRDAKTLHLLRRSTPPHAN